MHPRENLTPVGPTGTFPPPPPPGSSPASGRPVASGSSGPSGSGIASSSEPFLVALVGSANSGKTTLFNLLTHSHYTTVNYPGATVEHAAGSAHLPSGRPCRILDTPGLTSLLPASADEEVTVRALFEGSRRPDLVLAVVDATQLSRHLYLVRQLQEVGFPIAVVLTMGDLLEKRGFGIDERQLAAFLEAPVLRVDPRKKADEEKVGRFLDGKIAEADREKGPGSHRTPGPEREPEQGSAFAEVPSGGARKSRSSPLQTSYEEFAARLDDHRIEAAYEWLDQAEKVSIIPLSGAGKGPNPSREGGGGPGLDSILLHPVYGLLLFIGSMFAIFTAIFWLATPFMDLIDGGFAALIEAAKGNLPASWTTDLFADGLIGGVGAVLVFLPQILILFFAMGYLEDSGYLARGAALVDRPLSAIGLNGRSFVPLLSGYACAIPAILAARTIPNRFERNLTILIIPLMSCSARLPVYTLLLAFLTPRDKPWIGGLGLTGLYLLGLVLGSLVSTVVSRFRKNKARSSFILELPALRRPVFRVVAASTYHKAFQYLKKAGLTIVVIAVSLWVLTHTPTAGAGAGEGGEYVTVAESYAGRIGHFIEPVMHPLGLDWRAGVALICGFAAREVFVSSLALMYRIEDGEEDGLADRMLATMQTAVFEGTGERIFTLSSCLGILVFFLIALQCFPTVAVAKQEFGGWKPAAWQLLAYTGGAYVLAVLVVQGLRAFGLP